MVSLLVAYAHNRVIGKDNDLPWYLPADLRRFKELTTDKTVVMGRKTFDSIIARNGKPLPNRTNVVVTRDQSYRYEGVQVDHSIEDALKATGDIFVIGGAEIFRQALPLADRIYATEIDADIDGDVFMPDIDETVWIEKAREKHSADEKNHYNYAYVTYEKVND